MTAPAALPAHVRDDEGAVLTFIVPAERCNLRCAYCFINLRRESTSEVVLSVEDYGKFILDMAANRRIAALCIQGHEPLLPESFEYTKKILLVGQELNVPTSLVTNGTFLSDRLFDLQKLSPDRIAVSIDSHVAELHDKKRGKKGAFDLVIDGLRSVKSFPQLHQAITVTSVLLPNKRSHLAGMPSLLRSLNIPHWNVNILIKFDSDAFARPAYEREVVLDDLRHLNMIAKQYNINMTVDDEFKSLGDCEDETYPNRSNTLRFERLLNPSGVLRLLPNGQCSVGIEIMRKQNHDAPRWNPSWCNANTFIDEILEQKKSVPNHKIPCNSMAS